MSNKYRQSKPCNKERPRSASLRSVKRLPHKVNHVMKNGLAPLRCARSHQMQPLCSQTQTLYAHVQPNTTPIQPIRLNLAHVQPNTTLCKQIQPLCSQIAAMQPAARQYSRPKAQQPAVPGCSRGAGGRGRSLEIINVGNIYIYI